MSQQKLYEGTEFGDKYKVLIVTGDPIQSAMSGPGIRAWNIAEQLSKYCEVRLVSSTIAEKKSKHFDVDRISVAGSKSAKSHEKWADIIVVQGYALNEFSALAKTDKYLVCDVYAPMHLEELARPDLQHWDKYRRNVLDTVSALNFQLQRSDFIICASEKQRDFWLGQLAALGRLCPENYLLSSDLRKLIDVVPFGLSAGHKNTIVPVVRGVINGIEDDSDLLIWAGGIYDWFDPLSLITAVHEYSFKNPKIKLFFMGTKHPNTSVSKMSMVSRAEELASDLGALNKSVFFNPTWVDFDDRFAYLNEADMGVSTHFTHLETTYSYRTRILDYLWAGLPILSTEGDAFAEIIGKNDFGFIVGEQNIFQIKKKLDLAFGGGKEDLKRIKRNIVSKQHDYEWSTVLQPLIRYCTEPHYSGDRLPETSRARSMNPNYIVPGTSQSRFKQLFLIFIGGYKFLKTNGLKQTIEKIRNKS